MNILPLQLFENARTQAPPSTIRVLIRRSILLHRLYSHAAVVSEPGLQFVLSDNAKTLSLLIGELQATLGDNALNFPAPAARCGIAGRRLATWLIQATPRSEAGWLRLLSHRERALLQAFEVGIATAAPPHASHLRRQLPRLHSIHLDMNILAGITRH